MAGSNSTAMTLMEEMQNRLTKEQIQEAFKNTDTGITYQGKKITLPAEPAKMPTQMAIDVLKRKLEEENTFLDVHEVLEAYPDDACVAFNRAMKEAYGWAQAVPKMTLFGPMPPDLLTIKIGPKDTDTVQAPFGCFTLPGVENPIEMHRSMKEGFPCMVITGKVRRKELEVVKELAVAAKKILREESIFKGKSIRLKVDDDGDLRADLTPIFLETDNINPSELILNPEELSAVQSSLWAPIMHTKECVKNKIPLNRGVLLEGKYGTGKTMTAHQTSKVCVENGWTYILLDDVRGLKAALEFAQRYQPAVIFAEDIDRVTETRDQEGNDLLNTIDGVLTKNSKVITVMTTNHVEKINPAMLRPGRLDAIITIEPPGPDSVQRLIHLFGRELITAGEDLSGIGALIQGNIPATIREVVERAKLGMIFHGRKTINNDDLEASARSMSRHLKLMGEQKPELSKSEIFGNAFIDLMRQATGSEDADVLSDKLDATVGTLKQSTNDIKRSNGQTQAALAAQAKGVERVQETADKILHEVQS